MTTCCIHADLLYGSRIVTAALSHHSHRMSADLSAVSNANGNKHKKRKKKKPTAASCLKPEVPVVVFEERGKRRAERNEQDEESKGTKDAVPEFSWRRARHEVFRFGITGFEQKEQDNAHVSLAVKLGARVSL